MRLNGCFVWVACVLVLMATPSYALTPVEKTPLPDAPPATPQPALDGTAIAEEAQTVCDTRTVAEKQSAVPAVGPAYVEGVDAYGRPVAPASGPAEEVGSSWRIPVTYDVAKHMGVTLPGLEMAGQIGVFDITADGKVLYNGREITDKISIFCQQTSHSSNPQVPPHDTGRQAADPAEKARDGDNANPR